MSGSLPPTKLSPKSASPRDSVENLDPDLRVALVVARDHLRQKVVDGRRHASNGHFAHARCSHAADAQKRVIEVVQELLHLAIEVAPDRGQAHAPGGAVEQSHAERLLELFDASAEGGLRDMQRLRCLAEAVELGHRPECL
jgi:hypothetical protein